MEGFEKIDLDPVSANPTPREISKSVPDFKMRSRKKGSAFFKNKNVIRVIIVLIILVIISSFAVILPAQKVLQNSKKTYAQVKATVDAVKKQNIELASAELTKTTADLTETQKSLNSLGYLQFIPIAGWYYSDAKHLVAAGFYGLDAANVLIESVRPYADVLGLKGQGSFVGGTAEQRIETAVKTMGKVTPHIDDISKYLKDVKTEVDAVDANHYPSFLGFRKIHDSLLSLQKIVDEGSSFVEQAKPLIKVLPNLLGEPDSKKYLVLFQNDKELRPTGGFITAYSIFNIDRGKINVEKSDNIYNLDLSIPNKPEAPEPILKYLPNVYQFNIRDSNLSPDFIDSMKTFNSMYNKSSQKENVDGIIALDTNVLVSTIKILDNNVEAAGMTFTTNNDPRCDCPQVIYQLESSISTPLSVDLKTSNLEAIQASRKDIIGELLFAILNKALKSSPKLYWGALFQNLLTQIDQKHVLFDIYDADAQRGFEALNAAGRIKSFDGDYLHINEANFGGQKSNLFVSRSVTQNYQVKSDGSIVKTVTINYKNPYPASDCNLERGNLCLNAIYRNWFRIYTPVGSTLIDSQGSEVKMKSHEGLGKTVFEGFLTVRPEGTAAFTISYRLPFKATGILPLLIQKQPGTYNDPYAIEVNNNTVDKFNLSTDKELKINLK